MTEYNFNDPAVLGEALKKVRDSRMCYYVDADGQILISWNFTWISYEKAAKMFPELRLDNEN
jgi:hypothetical protein